MQHPDKNENENSKPIAGSDWFNELSPEDQASIDRGLQQLKEGKGIPHEQVIEMYPQYFLTRSR